jgi:branched-chain amino acid transport system permease protein
MLVGVVLGLVLGGLAGLLTWRLDGDYLLLAAFGTCEITRSLVTNLESVTGGSIGIMNIPTVIRGLPPRTTQLVVLATVCGAVGACWLFSAALRNSLFGRIQVAVQDDAVGTASLGHPVRRTKLFSVAIGSAWTALGGGLFAAYSSYVDPSSFTVDEAIMMFAMFVLGGMRSLLGTILGVTVFLSLPELLRLFGIPSEVASPLRRVFCGLLLLVVMRTRLLARSSRPGQPGAVMHSVGGEA